MTIDPKDLRTLLIRVAAITLAVRLVSLIGQDPGVHESALALGLDPAAREPWPQLNRGLLLAGGGFAAFLRLLPLLCEVAAPALAVAWARAAGWGAIPGLMAGLALAMGPLGLDAGIRADGVALTTAATVATLWLLRTGLRQGDWRWLAASALVLALCGVLAPGLLLVVPGGLYLAVRVIADPRIKAGAALAWFVAACLVIVVRWFAIGSLLPPAPVTATWWLGEATMDPSGWAQASASDSLLQSVAAVLPVGAHGALARQLELQPATLVAQVLGAGLLLTALAGLWRGRVTPDPLAVPADALPSGWRTVGLQVSVPRDLGDRDVVPLLLPLVAALAWLVWSAHAGDARCLAEVLGVGRATAALLLGVGLSARAHPRGQGDGASNKYTAWNLAAAAALLFAVGAVHLLAQTQAPDRQAPRKVARFVRESLGAKGALLAIGGRGLPVAFLLDPYRHEQRIALVPSEPAEALEQLTALLARGPDVVVLAGDRDALGPTDEQATLAPALESVWQFLLPTLQASGWQPVEDSHRFLGHTAVLSFVHEAPPAIKPQVLPGQAP